MTDHTALAQLYIDGWNETDPGRRRQLIARAWTEQASYVDPMMASDGHDGIDAMIAAVQQRFPGLRFSLSGDVEAHHDRMRFAWMLGPAGGAPLAKGTDFAQLSPDRRLQSVAGFIDMAPSGM